MKKNTSMNSIFDVLRQTTVDPSQAPAILTKPYGCYANQSLEITTPMKQECPYKMDNQASKNFTAQFKNNHSSTSRNAQNIKNHLN